MNPEIKPSKGPSRLSCTLKKGCEKGLVENADPVVCITCPKVLIEILDLDNEVVASFSPGAAKKVPPKKKKSIK